MKLTIKGQFTSGYFTKCHCAWCQGHPDYIAEKIHDIHKTIEFTGFKFRTLQQQVIDEELSKYPNQKFLRWITCAFTIQVI